MSSGRIGLTSQSAEANFVSATKDYVREMSCHGMNAENHESDLRGNRRHQQSVGRRRITVRIDKLDEFKFTYKASVRELLWFAQTILFPTQY